MDDKYKTFRCQKCLLHKKMSLFSHYEKNKQGKRAICTNCSSRILESANKRELELIAEARDILNNHPVPKGLKDQL